MHFGVKADYEALTATVVLNLGGRTIGMVVDAVSDVIVIDGGQLKAAPSFGDRIDVGYITALGALGEGERQRMLILMDVELLIRSADLGLVD
jgi:purine-binding chemotaxis protein CheW